MKKINENNNNKYKNFVILLIYIKLYLKIIKSKKNLKKKKNDTFKNDIIKKRRIT